MAVIARPGLMHEACPELKERARYKPLYVAHSARYGFGANESAK